MGYSCPWKSTKVYLLKNKNLIYQKHLKLQWNNQSRTAIYLWDINLKKEKEKKDSKEWGVESNYLQGKALLLEANTEGRKHVLSSTASSISNNPLVPK